MTTNLNRSQNKTRDRHAGDAKRRSPRPASQGEAGRSADEIRETVKEAVGKGVAAVAGAVEGVDETLSETQLAETAESAVRQVGETATKVVRAAKEETQNLKQAFQGEGAQGGDAGGSGGSSSGSGQLTEDDDWTTERDDPTFAGKPFGRRPTEANSSGSPLTYGADDEQSASTYDPADEDDESRAI